MSKLYRVLTVVGTRPEAIKMAPVVRALQSVKVQDRIKSQFGFTGQHRFSMVKPVLDFFEIVLNFGFLLDRTDSSLAHLTSQLVDSLFHHINALKPDFVFVHGDTTTALCTALAASYAQIPVGHVEAGLRTSRFEYPFPEEMNRRLISKLASIHFAPTVKAARNLYEEGVSPSRVFVTGNTVVDAVNYVLDKTIPGGINVFPLIPTRQVVLITCHRRESWGEPLKQLCDVIKDLASKNSDYIFVWPVHPNPDIMEIVQEKLKGIENVRLYGPLEYTNFVWLLKVCQVVVTDSGGVLEEAAVLGVPTLVLRSETERPEAFDLNGVELVGYDFDLLREKIISFVNKPPATEKSENFGNGHAGELITNILLRYLDEVNHVE